MIEVSKYCNDAIQATLYKKIDQTVWQIVHAVPEFSINWCTWQQRWKYHRGATRVLSANYWFCYYCYSPFGRNVCVPNFIIQEEGEKGVVPLYKKPGKGTATIDVSNAHRQLKNRFKLSLSLNCPLKIHWTSRRFTGLALNMLLQSHWLRKNGMRLIINLMNLCKKCTSGVRGFTLL